MLLGVSFIAMVPFMVIAERKRLVKPFFVGAVALIVLALAQMPLARHNLYGAMVSLWLFFLAFNFLEAMLPSLLKIGRAHV